MTDYETKAKTIGDITVTVSKATEGNAGERLVAFLKWLGTKPSTGLPPEAGHKPGDVPDNSLPGAKPDRPGVGPGTPDQGLPGQPPSAGQPLPPQPGHPGHPLPPEHGHPDHDLPGFIAKHAEEIAKIILKGTACDMDKPKGI